MRKNCSALRFGSHSVFRLKRYTLNYSSLTRRGSWCWEITHSLCKRVWKSRGVEIKHDNKIMEMSVTLHMRHPWKYSWKKKQIITLGKQYYVAYFYSYKTQRVDKTICNYISARKFAITLTLNVLSEMFVQIIRYKPIYLKNLVY